MPMRRLGPILGIFLLLGNLLTACSLPQVSAEERLFLNVSVQLLGEYSLPPQTFAGTAVGGLSAIAYHPQTDEYYVLSDDRGRQTPSRFYTLDIDIGTDAARQPTLENVTLTRVTSLQQADGQPFPAGALDPEGLALSPRNTLFISSEGDIGRGIPPLLGEFDRQSGQLLTELRLPQRYLPDAAEPPTQGIQNNLGLESLAVNLGPTQAGWIEPFRLFTAAESALVQDYDDDPNRPLKTRLLHYLIGEAQATLIAEHAYPLDLEPMGAVVNGLAELLVIDQAGHFLALERAYGLKGFQVKLYQLASGGATDTSAIASLKGDLSNLRPIQKQLVVNIADLGIEPDNLEGMTLGPRLPDGSQSLILISDNNFAADRATQILLLRLQLS